MRKKVRVILLLVLGIGLFISGWILQERVRHWTKKSECSVTGGRWTYPAMPLGAPRNDGYCYYPPEDEGKRCYENSDCERDCVSTREVDEEGYIVGRCGEYSVLECVPTIEFKTKERKDLVGGSCV